VVEEGTHKTPDLTAVLPEWDPIGNRVSYGLYRRYAQEHITRLERIPDRPIFEWLGRLFVDDPEELAATSQASSRAAETERP
jgi:hypothetical protein